MAVWEESKHVDVKMIYLLIVITEHSCVRLCNYVLLIIEHNGEKATDGNMAHALCKLGT
jgi:hypothetical protein